MSKGWSSLDLSQSDSFIIPNKISIGYTGITGALVISSDNFYFSDGTSWIQNGGYVSITDNGSPLIQRHTLDIKLPSGGILSDGTTKTILNLTGILPERQSANLIDYSDNTNTSVDLMYSVLKWPTGSTFLLGKTTGIYNFYLPLTGIPPGWTYTFITKSVAGPNNFRIYESSDGSTTGSSAVTGSGLFFQTSGLKLVLTFNGTIWKFHGEVITNYGGFTQTIQT